MTIEQTARRLRAREISAVELARESLKTIHAEQPRLNAFITITEETALEQARRADEDFAKGIDRSPLQGIPYALKDLFDTKGIRTTGGTKIFADRVPTTDCTVYEKLREAGAVLMGKTGLHEFAYGITNNNPHFGPVRNPHDPSRIPGGSSGGSGAAVAAGMVAFALGSDTGGSIRIPAAYCGCTGHKPTYGIVSRYGCMPLGNNLDHMGPLATTPRDAALVMDAIAGYDSRDDSSTATPAGNFWRDDFSLRGVRAGIPENFFTERLAPEVAAAFQTALDRAKSAGAELKPIRVPDPESLNAIGRVILMAEVSALMEPYAHRRDEFGPDVIALIDQGRLLPATDYVNAQRLRRRWQREWAKVWKDIDIVLTPTAPIVAPKIGQATVSLGGNEEDARLATTRLVRSINVLGLPAVSVPLPVAGLPIGLQIIGPPFADNLVLSVGGCLA
ncbi:MAG TPA: amidase [Bryobacteraceae bacterium]|jgi:aspartyl-tRNA(Asn)/glutamyl-tRNA(Gln) amidotransferase subunit A